MQIAEKIRILLIKRGNISVAELARRLGMAPQNLNRKLKRDTFSVSDLEKIAQALDCELNISFRLLDRDEVL